MSESRIIGPDPFLDHPLTESLFETAKHGADHAVLRHHDDVDMLWHDHSRRQFEAETLTSAFEMEEILVSDPWVVEVRSALVAGIGQESRLIRLVVMPGGHSESIA